jgi:hypothetical protein
MAVRAWMAELGALCSIAGTMVLGRGEAVNDLPCIGAGIKALTAEEKQGRMVY